MLIETTESIWNVNNQSILFNYYSFISELNSLLNLLRERMREWEKKRASGGGVYVLFILLEVCQSFLPLTQKWETLERRVDEDLESDIRNVWEHSLHLCLSLPNPTETINNWQKTKKG